MPPKKKVAVKRSRSPTPEGSSPILAVSLNCGVSVAGERCTSLYLLHGALVQRLFFGVPQQDKEVSRMSEECCRLSFGP